jgi:predicted nucleotidyltransferase
MIHPADRTKIQQLAEKYSASRVLLFGSAITDPDPQDIDLAVDGILPENFFKFYSELMWNLSRPIDLIDLSEKSKFCNLIETEGSLLYAAN